LTLSQVDLALRRGHRQVPLTKGPVVEPAQIIQTLVLNSVANGCDCASSAYANLVLARRAGFFSADLSLPWALAHSLGVGPLTDSLLVLMPGLPPELNREDAGRSVLLLGLGLLALLWLAGGSARSLLRPASAFAPRGSAGASLLKGRPFHGKANQPFTRGSRSGKVSGWLSGRLVGFP